MLEEGQRKDWFGSPIIVEGAALAVFGIGGFILRELMAERPFINLRVLKNRSVGGGCLLMTVLGAVSFGSIYVIPVYCAQIQGYNAEQIGYVVMWSGLASTRAVPRHAAADEALRPAAAGGSRNASVRAELLHQRQASPTTSAWTS